MTLENLTEKDYSDLVLVKAVKFVKETNVWAVSGDKRARVYNKFRNKGIKVPSNYDGHYFDVTAIYGTGVVDGEVVDTQLVDYGSEITPPEMADREGYTFGWDAYPPTMPAHDLTITGSTSSHALVKAAHKRSSTSMCQYGLKYG